MMTMVAALRFDTVTMSRTSGLKFLTMFSTLRGLKFHRWTSGSMVRSLTETSRSSYLAFVTCFLHLLVHTFANLFSKIPECHLAGAQHIHDLLSLGQCQL